MTLTQLRYFIAVGRNRSMSKAAAEMNVVQPALTRQLMLLEAELGTTLVVRHNRGIDLTDAGQLFLERAEYCIQNFDQMRSEFTDQARGLQGLLRVGCPSSMTRPFITETLATLTSRHVNLRLEFREAISDQLIADILTDSLDVAIVSAGSTRQHLVVEQLFVESIWLFGHSSCEMPDIVALEFLVDLPLIVGRPNNPARQKLEQAMEASGLSLNIAFETDSTQLIDHMVERGRSYVAAPYLSNFHKLASGSLKGAPIDRLTLERCLIRRKDRPMTRVMNEFIALVRAQADAMKNAGSGH